MIRQISQAVTLSVVLMALGCGSGTVTPDANPVQATPAKNNIKLALQDIAKSGATGSAMNDITTNADLLAKTDAALAETLKKDAEELQGLTGSAKIKAKAEEMLKKVE